MWNLRGPSRHQVLENSQSLNVTYSQPIPSINEIKVCQKKKLVLCCRCWSGKFSESQKHEVIQRTHPAMIQPRTELSHCHEEKDPRYITWTICMCATAILCLLGLAGQIMHSFIFFIKVFIRIKQSSVVMKLTKEILLIKSK